MYIKYLILYICRYQIRSTPASINNIFTLSLSMMDKRLNVMVNRSCCMMT